MGSNIDESEDQVHIYDRQERTLWGRNLGADFRWGILDQGRGHSFHFCWGDEPTRWGAPLTNRKTKGIFMTSRKQRFGAEVWLRIFGGGFLLGGGNIFVSFLFGRLTRNFSFFSQTNLLGGPFDATGPEQGRETRASATSSFGGSAGQGPSPQRTQF